MKRALLLLICVLAVGGVFAQSAADALKNDTQTLRERFLVMKMKSQNYQEYKVIKENILDGVWKIVLDSMNTKQAAIRKAQADIIALQAEVNKNAEALKAKEESMKDVLFASTHINVLGIDFEKGFFAGLVGVLLLLAALAVTAVVYTMKVLKRNLAEKEDLASTIASEYEDYKRRAMEKQTKLSRELQNERNKLMELGSL